MYCSSCGGKVAPGLSYCNQCGVKLNGATGDRPHQTTGLRAESLVWAMVAVLVFGFIAIVFLMMAMKMVGLNIGQILAFTILSFLIMLVVEGVFITQLLYRKRGGEDTVDTAISRKETTKELDAAHALQLPEAMPSVTEHTTRTLQPIYSERKSK
jgi:hypothetical protein